MSILANLLSFFVPWLRKAIRYARALAALDSLVDSYERITADGKITRAEAATLLSRATLIVRSVKPKR